MRDGRKVVKQFQEVLSLIVVYDSKPYIKCMMTYLLYLKHIEKKNPKLYEWILRNIDALDEERGELSLAKLRECTLRDVDQANCSKLHMNYTLLPLVAEVVADLKTGEICCFSVRNPNLTLILHVS